MTSKAAAQAAQSLSRVVPVNKKYTVQSHGVWERIRRLFAIDPSRSTGVPLNPQYRNPTPGALGPQTYDDPVTVPSGDIADNPYWKRDVRRNYPQLSVVNQADVVGLLTVGSAATPKDEVLKLGDAGTKQLVEIRQDGEERGLSNFFGTQKVESVLTPAILEGRDLDKAISQRQMPPMPTALGQNASATPYTQLEEEEQGYPDRYDETGLL
ncbi:MAG: hypothetical protein Q9160_000997 [Pyrenula sp. 1 TL-2023]